MAIVNTRTVARVTVVPSMYEDEYPCVEAIYIYSFDDTNDDSLPVTTQKSFMLHKTTTAINDQDEPVVSDTDISSHDLLVQSICNAVWSQNV